MVLRLVSLLHNAYFVRANAPATTEKDENRLSIKKYIQISDLLYFYIVKLRLCRFNKRLLCIWCTDYLRNMKCLYTYYIQILYRLYTYLHRLYTDCLNLLPNQIE